MFSGDSVPILKNPCFTWRYPGANPKKQRPRFSSRPKNKQQAENKSNINMDW